jgi:hypothetical protein
MVIASSPSMPITISEIRMTAEKGVSRFGRLVSKTNNQANFWETNIGFQVRSDGEGTRLTSAYANQQSWVIHSASNSGAEKKTCAEKGESTPSCCIGSLLQSASSPNPACHGSVSRTLESELKIDGAVRELVSAE